MVSEVFWFILFYVAPMYLSLAFTVSTWAEQKKFVPEWTLHLDLVLAFVPVVNIFVAFISIVTASLLKVIKKMGNDNGSV